MSTICLPYGRQHMELVIPAEKLNGVLRSHVEDFSGEDIEEKIVRRSLENPIESPRLCQIAKEAKRVLVITSDHTRPVPSHITMPLLLEEIRSLNNEVQVKILIATGSHRATTCQEMEAKFGKDITDKEEILVHDCRDKSKMVYKGVLPSSGELWLNSLVDWADLVVSEGFIEPHFFAGFSGGRKSILPGIASEKTVFSNHCSKFIANPMSRTGNLDGNPIHNDMIFAANAAKLRFILNVVLNDKKEIINSFSGECDSAHLAGCSFVSQLCRVPAVPSKIVITTNGGYPLDQNIYQAVKCMTAASASIKGSGVIIVVAACEDGHGGETFYRDFKDASCPEEVLKRIEATSQVKTSQDQWQSQILANILIKHKVIIVTDRCDPQLIKDMHMLHADNIEKALNMAYEIVGSDAKVLVIPDGVSVIVE